MKKQEILSQLEEEKVEKEEAGPGAAAAPLKHLPTIDYNRAELDEIVEKIPLDENIKSAIDAKLEIIEGRIDSIHEGLRTKNPADFYTDIRLSITEIKNAAKAIFELARPYRITLANQLQKKVLNWMNPLDKELNIIMEISDEERKKLEFKTKRLYAQQSLICRQEDLQRSLMEQLEQLKWMLQDSNSLEPHCYISYAWPNPENKEHEYWVQPFLSILYDHLTQAGIRMIMDIRDNKPGNDIYQFMSHYKDGNHIILIGTESLLQKHASEKTHAIKAELSAINWRFEEDQKQYGESRIYPLLISGTHRSSFPSIYDKYRTVREGRDDGYILLLKNLIEWLYSLRIEREVSIKLKYQTLWGKFLSNYPRFVKDFNEALVEQEMAENYHRKRLYELNQDLVYRSIKAQQEVKHSKAVITKIIAAQMESVGPVPKALFEENGQQFQRPYTNQNFVERKSLWDKMLARFASQEKLVLMAAHGLGGMGKTELAAYYYLHPPRPYNLRAWFNATTKSQLYQQYIEFAEANGKFFRKEMPIEEQAQMVKKWLEEQKDCLLVYDNVDNASEIDGLLPVQGKHHILITSRNAEDFPAEQCLPVDIMEEHEAIELIIKITGINKDENLAQLQELVYILGFLPLALAQAAGFIGKTVDIAEYISIYREHQSKLLNNKDEKNPLLPNHEPIWITFDINLEVLREDCPRAITTLKQASWIASSAIPEFYLSAVEEFVGVDNRPLLWANVKKHLHRYSLMRVDTERGLMSIHPILQDILRSKQTDLEKINIFKERCSLLNGWYECLEKNGRQYRWVLPHAERLQQHSATIVEKLKDDNIENALLLLEPSCLERLYLNLGLSNEALSYTSQELSIYERLYGIRSIKIVTPIVNQAVAFAQLGRIDKAKESYERALAIQEDNYDKDHFEIVPILGNLSNAYLQLGNIKKALELSKRALAIQEKHCRIEHIDTTRILLSLGNAYVQLGNYVEAAKYYEQTLNIQESLYRQDHFEMAPVLANLGVIYSETEDFIKAVECCMRALKIQDGHYGENHFETVKPLMTLGVVAKELGYLDKALEVTNQALLIAEKHYGKNHLFTAGILANIGRIYQQIGKLDSAIKYSELALNIRKRHYGVDHFETAIILSNLGSMYCDLSDINKTREYCERALVIQEHHFGTSHIKITDTLVTMAKVYVKLDGTDKAIECLERVLNIKKSFYGKEHLKTEEALKDLFSICFHSNNLKKAIEYGKRVLNIKEKYYDKEHLELTEILLKISSLYIKLKQPAQAKQHLLRAKMICERETDAKQYLAHIESLLQEAEKQKQNILKESNDLAARGIQLYKEDKHHEALRFLLMALKKQKTVYEDIIHEDVATLNFNLGSTYFKLQNYQEAIPHLQQSLDMRIKLLGIDNEKTVKAKARLEECKCLLKDKGAEDKEGANNQKNSNVTSPIGTKLKPNLT